MVECTNGGFDGRFDHGENTKELFETRTPAKHWEIDSSLHSENVSPKLVLNTHLKAALMSQEQNAERVRQSYRMNRKNNQMRTDTLRVIEERKGLVRRGLITPTLDDW